MTLPRHKEYKDTANQWLGKIPSHWRATKLGYLTSKIGSGKTPHGGADVYTSSGILFVRSQNVYDEGLALDDVVYISAETDAEMPWSRVAPGDILLNITGASLGRTCLVPDEFSAANVNQHVCIIRLSEEELRPYIALVMKSAAIKAQIDATQNGAAREGLNFEQISKLVLAIPPFSEQAAIAAFLDRETGKIDALVAEQEKLIALLKEKRQAVISYAVTKGLNPAAPMKDSGIAWLGEVPLHWDVVPTGYRHEVQLGRMLNGERASGDHERPYLRVFDVQWGLINVDELPTMDFPPEVQDRYRLRPGDLLVNEGGSYVGRSAIWRGDLDECYYQKALHRLRPLDAERDTTEFFFFVMEMATRQGVFVAGGNQTTIDHLTAEQLRQYRFAFPPIEEQRAIAARLKNVTQELDELLLTVDRSVGLLRERRTALISAAVAGKIDVRGLVDMQEAA